MASPTDPKEFNARRPLVRSGDPPGAVGSLRMLARAMLSLTDSNGGREHTPPDKPDRRRWGQLAHAIYRERARRSEFFPTDLFGEPAWDILLDLYVAAKYQELRSVKSVCLSSNVPEATALRYVDQLVDHGLVERKRDKIDKRRKFLSLTALGQQKMHDYLLSMPPIGDHGEDLIRELLMSP